MHPLFTVVSRVHASTATGVANLTAGESPSHKHTPDCERKYNADHNVTSHLHNLTTQSKGHAMEEGQEAAKAMGNPSPYPRFNASAYNHPHADQAHNHTGDYCNHPSHHNETATDATYDKMIHPRMLQANAKSSHNHTGDYCTHPSHHSSTTSTTANSYDKKSVSPGVDVTVCLGADCSDSKVVTANLNSAGELTGVDAQNGRRVVRRQDTEVWYEDVARQMSGAEIAGGI